MLQIIHFLVFQFDIVFQGIPLFFGFEIIIRDVQGEKYISGISALLSVSLAVCALVIL